MPRRGGGRRRREGRAVGSCICQCLRFAAGSSPYASHAGGVLQAPAHVPARAQTPFHLAARTRTRWARPRFGHGAPRTAAASGPATCLTVCRWTSERSSKRPAVVGGYTACEVALPSAAVWVHCSVLLLLLKPVMDGVQGDQSMPPCPAPRARLTPSSRPGPPPWLLQHGGG